MKKEYLHSIEKGIAENKIVILEEKQDAYSHFKDRKVFGEVFLSGFSDYNTRNFPRKALGVLDELEKGRGGPYSVLELGAGCGRGTYEFSRRRDWKVDALGLTPFAPHIRVLKTGREMVQDLLECLTKDSSLLECSIIKKQLEFYWWMCKWKVEKGLKSFFHMNQDELTALVKEAANRPWGVSFDTAFLLHDRGCSLFQRENAPVRRQYIGTLAQTISRIQENYDLMIDHWGALHYTLKEERDDAAISRILRDIIRGLNHDGILWVSNLRKNKIGYFTSLENVQVTVNKTEMSKMVELRLRKK